MNGSVSFLTVQTDIGLFFPCLTILWLQEGYNILRILIPDQRTPDQGSGDVFQGFGHPISQTLKKVLIHIIKPIYKSSLIYSVQNVEDIFVQSVLIQFRIFQLNPGYQ